MKKTTFVAVIAVIALVSAGVAFAQMGTGVEPGMGYGYGMMGNSGDNTGNSVNVESLKKFQKETLSLRDELITKRAELANEYNKPTPDTARITALQHQIIDIRAKIEKAAVKDGLTAGGWGSGRGYGYGMGPGMMYGYGYNGYRGPGMMYGGGPYDYGCSGD
jgi:Spy/CpxP family protein refolding chaperone